MGRWGEPDNGIFVLEDVLDVILRLKQYLGSINYSIDMGRGGPDSETPEPIDVFIEKFRGQKLSHIYLYIYKQ